jgi:lysophospholipase L1-like esterase
VITRRTSLVLVALTAIATLLLVGLALGRGRAATAPSTNPEAAASTASAPSQPEPATRPKLTVIGDSYTGGSNMNSGPATLWTTLASRKLNVQFQILAHGGSGYLARGPGSDTTTFVERAASVSSDAVAVVFFGSRNDPTDSARLYEAAFSAYRNASKAAPRAKLIVIGPPWVDEDPSPGLLENRDALKRAAGKAGAVFVDPIADNWFPNGSHLIGSDNVHPTDRGHKRMAERIEPVIAAELRR